MKSKLRTLDIDEPVRKKKKKVKEEPITTTKKKKRPVEDEDADKPKKKKKKVSVETALRVAGAVSRLDAKGKNSIIGETAEDIQRMLEVGHNEGAVTLIQKRLLQAVIDLLPHAENNVRDTGGSKGVYQFNTLITSMRELISDIQATRDRGAIGINLVEKIVRPSFLDIGMALVQEEARFATAIRDLVTPEIYQKLRTEHKSCVERIGHVMAGKYEEVKDGTIQFLQT